LDFAFSGVEEDGEDVDFVEGDFMDSLNEDEREH
jgi:hypothetical protein